MKDGALAQLNAQKNAMKHAELFAEKTTKLWDAAGCTKTDIG
jgi:hypothetical protein